MKVIILILLLASAHTISAQSTLTVDDFSEKYYGKVFISDLKEVFSQGWIAIYDKKTQKELIKVEADELSFNLHDGKIVSNIKELPYGEQSNIIYEDFNFDGKNDFALMDGQNSCYHGPSFQVYLATGTGFKHSPGFTRLAQEYCGMFDVDIENETLLTMTKSGCCWHQFSNFKVNNNEPYAIRILERGISTNGVVFDHVEKNLVNGKMTERKYSIYEEGYFDDEELILFLTFPNEKKMRLIKHGETLFYIFSNKKDIVELLYSGNFIYSQKDASLKFKNHDAEYKIYSDGITVAAPENSANRRSKDVIAKGSLSRLIQSALDNVKID